MNLNDYFDPIDFNFEFDDNYNLKEILYSSFSFHTSENKIRNIENFNIAIIGIVNDHIKQKENSVKGLLKIREHLYSLTSFNKQIKIYDLGNLKRGNSVNDHSIGLRDVLIELLTLNIIPIIIGSSEDIIYPNYLAYQKLEKKINLVSIDSKIRVYENREKEFKSALWKIMVENNDSLLFFSNIGYQSHFVNSRLLKFISDQFHFSYRLGYIRSKIKEVEPIFRDADIIGLNISSVRQSDAFGQQDPSPNGYYGEEICQLARYAGLSTKLTSFGIYDYNSATDINSQTANLIAQIIWYFIDGFINRTVEYPYESERDYKKFIVNLDNIKQELIFYKSEKTNRWWVEVPAIKSDSSKYILISCTYEDYVEAGNGDIPERWLKTFQKIN
ncbi:MAG TPA: arginase [Bacteroidales bacterium]|nr:arginase [Bacteroidales bacterium]